MLVFLPFQEGNLKRYPTPYPDELKNMVKTAQSVAHRLKEDESGDESGKDAKPTERNHIGVQDVGVKVGFRQITCTTFLLISNPFSCSLTKCILGSFFNKQSFFFFFFLLQVIEAPCPNGTASDMDSQISTNTYSQNPSATETKDTESYSAQRIPLKSSGGPMMNHEDTLEVSICFSQTTRKCKRATLKPSLFLSSGF